MAVTYENPSSGKTVSVTVPDGWEFLCWLHPVSNGFVGSAYINRPYSNPSQLWIYANGNGSWTLTAVLLRKGIRA